MERVRLTDGVGKPITERVRLKDTDTGGAYFKPESRIETFSSGCTLLDCVLSGGWATNRIVNVIGDRASSKTLLAIEASANFVMKYPKAKVYYAEVESAFDTEYAAALGLPIDKVEFVEDCFTVEDLFEHLETVLQQEKAPTLYIVDSLDALSDRAELDRELDKGSYGATKAKQVSQLFRRLVQRLADSTVTIMIISQERDNIGVTFGKKSTRSGGRALDFYASQILWLSQRGKIEKTKGGVERVIGINVRAKCEKNKVGNPFRECDFPVYFGFGIDDVESAFDWFEKLKRWDAIGLKKEIDFQRFRKLVRGFGQQAYMKEREQMSRAVKKLWAEIELGFAPKWRKYT